MVDACLAAGVLCVVSGVGAFALGGSWRLRFTVMYYGLKEVVYRLSVLVQSYACACAYAYAYDMRRSEYKDAGKEKC